MAVYLIFFFWGGGKGVASPSSRQFIVYGKGINVVHI